ncbi:hypothetical protein GL267_007310 [Acidithiobacillus ferrianus]|uniref:Uncharacterized protein n=2 Tax=Acidithiobacillus ferrianus TaxID=2678518 RepID=A0A845UI11_9PROT|nr:hypothetical protein [Acidithiobacillus ferrianus]NDU43474.1 hypothetical protein [Acidithiobacillus ferrianus]
MSRARQLAEEIPFFDLTLDPQEQREADLLAFGDADETLDPDFADWCQPARLQREFADPDIGVKYLQEIGDSEFDDAIEKVVHAAIYLTEKQLENKHDRLMMDVPKDGHCKGGTHAIAPENRRIRYAKIVNGSLTCKALVQIPGEEDVHEKDRLEREEAEAFRIGVNARIKRELAYCLTVYKGKYKHVLELMAELKTVPQIAAIVGKTARRIQQIVHGNASKGRKPQKGLEQICREIVACGVPSTFQSPAPTLVLVPMPVVVQPVRTRKKALQKEAPVAQLGWDFDAMGVAA